MSIKEHFILILFSRLKVLKLELDFYKPKIAIFFTGLDWAKCFIEKLFNDMVKLTILENLFYLIPQVGR